MSPILLKAKAETKTTQSCLRICIFQSQPLCRLKKPQEETSKLGDGVGDPDFQLLVNNEEPATFNQEEEEEEEGEDISESKDEVMHRPVITVRRGHQAVRKHSIDDYGEVGAQLMETESGRFRVAMEGDSIMQDGESVLDLDDVSIMSRSTIGEMISPMKEAPSKAPASAHQVPRPLTRG